MKEIHIRSYIESDCDALVKIFYNTIHKVNIRDYTQEQVNAWAPESSLETAKWAKKWEKLVPWVAISNHDVAGFVEFEPNGHIDCFYVHHAQVGKGVGKTLMRHVKA